MIWTNEEGSLYPPAMMCSGIVCYDYLPEDIRSKFKYEDMMNSKSILDNKSTFGEALEKSGLREIRNIVFLRKNMSVILKLISSRDQFLRIMEMISVLLTVCLECSTID